MWKVGAQASFGDEASSGEVEIKGEYSYPLHDMGVKTTKFLYSSSEIASEEAGGETVKKQS